MFPFHYHWFPSGVRLRSIDMYWFLFGLQWFMMSFLSGGLMPLAPYVRIGASWALRQAAGGFWKPRRTSEGSRMPFLRTLELHCRSMPLIKHNFFIGPWGPFGTSSVYITIYELHFFLRLFANNFEYFDLICLWKPLGASGGYFRSIFCNFCDNFWKLREVSGIFWKLPEASEGFWTHFSDTAGASCQRHVLHKKPMLH